MSRKQSARVTLGGDAPSRPAPTINHHSYTMAGETITVSMDAAVMGMLWETVFLRYLPARGSDAVAPIHQRRYDMLVAALISFEEAAGVKQAAAKRAKPIDTPTKPVSLKPVAKPRIIRKRGN